MPPQGDAAGGDLSIAPPGHALECAECRTLWNEHVLLAQAIGEWRSRTPEIDLADRILHRWREDRASDHVDSESVDSATSEALPVSHASLAPISPAANAILVSRESSARDASTRQASGAQKAVVAVVAATLVSVFVAWSAFGPDEGSRIAIHRNETQGAAGSPATGTPAGSAAVAETPVLPAAEPEFEVVNIVRDVSTAYLALAGNAAASVRGAASLVPSEELPLSGSDESEPSSDPSSDQNVSPWRKNIGRALDLLWEPLPIEEAPAT